MTLYVEMCDDRYPPSWVSQARPFNTVTLTCPSVARQRKLGGYEFNGALFTKMRSQVGGGTIAFFETDLLQIGLLDTIEHRGTKRHGKESSVVYVDGHAQFLPNP